MAEPPYSDVDRAKPPDAKISESDTAWALWQEASSPPPSNFAPTQPVSLPMPLPEGDRRYAATVPSALTKPSNKMPASRAPSIGRVTAQEVLAEARRNNRVCPQPRAWQALYEMLPGKRQVERGWEPAPPLTGTAWTRTPALAKRMCLRDHIEWAERQGCLDAVFEFLKQLPEEDWLYIG
jgi:hypothetical protein